MAAVDTQEKLGSDVQPKALSVEVAARRLGLGRAMVYQLMADGLLPYHQFGRARRLDAADVERFWESCKRGGGRIQAPHRECCDVTEPLQIAANSEADSQRVANVARPGGRRA